MKREKLWEYCDNYFGIRVWRAIKYIIKNKYFKTVNSNYFY